LPGRQPAREVRRQAGIARTIDAVNIDPLATRGNQCAQAPQESPAGAYVRLHPRTTQIRSDEGNLRTYGIQLARAGNKTMTIFYFLRLRSAQSPLG